MTGLVISGFGLSAFLFSSIAHLFFPGNTSDFLLLLSLGTSVPPLIGQFFIRIVPPPSRPGHVDPLTSSQAPEAFAPIVGPNAYDRLDDHPAEEDESEFVAASMRIPSSPNMRKPLLERLSQSPEQPKTSHSQSPTETYHQHPLSSSMEGADFDDTGEVEELREQSQTEGLLSGTSRRSSMVIQHPDVHGMELLKSGEFWLIFTILALRMWF